MDGKNFNPTGPRKDRAKFSARGIEFVLAAVLIVAAGLKVYQRFLHFDPRIAPQGILQFCALIQAEILLCIWLCLGGFPRARFVVCLTCFSSFAVEAIFMAAHARPSCGCFGNVKIAPQISAGFDLSAVAALLWTRCLRRDEKPMRIARAISGLGAAMVVSALLWSIYFLRPTAVVADNKTVSAPDGTLVVLEPASWVNTPFPFFNEIDCGNQLRRGRWLLVLYHYDCDSCRQAIPKYRSLALNSRNDSGQPYLAFIAVPPLAPGGQDPVPPSASYAHLSLRPDHDWFATTPVVVALQDGKVLVAADGENAVRPPDIPQWR